MALRIKNNAIYSPDGEKLKDIYCPRKVDQADLKNRSDGHFDCGNCNQVIMNTDFISEKQLIDLLQQAPETCLLINLENPLFEVLD